MSRKNCGILLGVFVLASMLRGYHFLLRPFLAMIQPATCLNNAIECFPVVPHEMWTNLHQILARLKFCRWKGCGKEPYTLGLRTCSGTSE